MLRRPPTTLQLAQDDVSELIAELEEEKLQQRIQSQRKNLIRSSTRVESGRSDDGGLSEPVGVDSSFQISPLDGKRLPVELSEGPPRASSHWSNNNRPNKVPNPGINNNNNSNSNNNAELAGLNTTNPNTEGNPFFNQSQ
ncbi:hypothetical protein ZYGR_0AK06860 [Zygosaccharomyces rouxii]|uniref:Uncharacterized protein n=1 Tax=Zygosaccharomyces rouxii TaxID=4956 RepID=A0A1Q3AEL3_ZYGRO|nr:hypothetical protein ZYGR_0AK06860 [Zygosaccharomyces rouxii]